MKFKRIIALLTGAVVLGTSAISASAVSYDYTETYYVYQQETWGQVVMYPDHAYGTTYCELASANKMTHVVFSYMNDDGNVDYETAGDHNYYYNNQIELQHTTETPTNLDYCRGSRTESGVKVTSYITWTSAGCNDNAQVGVID